MSKYSNPAKKLMRKSSFIILAASLAACLSCSRQEEQAGGPGPGRRGDYITAIGPGIHGKTTVHDTTKVFWTSGDKIGLYSDEGATAVYTTTLDEPAAQATFGRTSDSKPALLGGRYYAVYPSSAIARWDLQAGSETAVCRISVPRQQTAVKGAWDPKAAVLLASSTTKELAFKHAVAYLRFEVTAATGEFVSVRVTSNNKEKLSDSQAAFRYLTDGIALEPSASAAEYVSLRNSDAVFDDGAYYIAFLPGEYADGLTLSFSNADGMAAKKTVGALTLNPGEVSDWGKISALSFTEHETPIEEEVGSSIDTLQQFDLFSTPMRVSLAGDSITSYEGTLVTDFAGAENGGAYYPTGSVNSVAEQYWYKLIYGKMRGATLEVNNSLRGSMITRRTEEGYEGKDFAARVADYGLGSPDVVFVHGGTNDCTHHSDTYTPRPGMYRADLYPPEFSGMTCDLPTEQQFEEVFTAAEAADTWEKILALEDRYFIHAYVKLLNMIHFRYPGARVVIIIPDCITKRCWQSLHKIADHYGQVFGYRYVDFFTDGSSNPDISKVSGVHPDGAGFTYMADIIYQETGEYIDPQ